MSCFDVLDSLVSEGNGYLLTSGVVASGISKETLATYVKARGMERVAHGLYLSPDGWNDELYNISVLNSRVVLSHKTALYLHGLMEREPNDISATVCAGYNATHLRKKGVRVYQVKPEVFAIGQTELKTNYDNTVRVYDIDRTICDIIAIKDDMDIQIFSYAIKEYMSSNQKDLNNLMAYAKLLQIESKVRLYTEVML